ncbi:hypothetical protein T484DRAFT_1830066 [Baffinella frigidus]|nr:hypothetical protein T484DRAFT_1830066 [Cryptophyta sp. CCMP2293]
MADLGDVPFGVVKREEEEANAFAAAREAAWVGQEAALERQAKRALAYFRERRDDLNKMVRGHEARKPKDVGQAKTARKGPTNGRNNMILTTQRPLELSSVRTARKGPTNGRNNMILAMQYGDMSIKWKFDFQRDRIIRQRAVVVRAQQRYRQIKEDLRGLQAMRQKAESSGAGPTGPPRNMAGPPRHVAMKGTDLGGIALLKERIRADESMSLPVRNLKLELMKRMKDEV